MRVQQQRPLLDPRVHAGDLLSPTLLRLQLRPPPLRRLAEHSLARAFRRCPVLQQLRLQRQTDVSCHAVHSAAGRRPLRLRLLCLLPLLSACRGAAGRQRCEPLLPPQLAPALLVRLPLSPLLPLPLLAAKALLGFELPLPLGPLRVRE